MSYIVSSGNISVRRSCECPRPSAWPTSWRTGGAPLGEHAARHVREAVVPSGQVLRRRHPHANRVHATLRPAEDHGILQRENVADVGAGLAGSQPTLDVSEIANRRRLL